MGKKRVLIVEDEILTAVCLKTLLENNGFEIIDIANKGKEAIQKSLETKPDMILMDIYLKNHITGIDVAKEISKYENIPILYLTANFDQDTRQKALNTNPVDIMEKPFNDSILIEKMESFFNKAG